MSAVAPDIVATPLSAGLPNDLLQALSRMGQIGITRDIAEAVLYLIEARNVTGVVLNVDGGSHLGKCSGDDEHVLTADTPPTCLVHNTA